MKNTLFLLLLFLIPVSSLQSCKKARRSVNDAIEALDRLRTDLVQESQNWQGHSDLWRDLIRETQENLSEDFVEIVNRLDEITTDAERAAANIISCNEQYLLEYIAYQVELAIMQFSGSVTVSGGSLVDAIPVGSRTILCHAFNAEINISDGEADELRFSINGYFGNIGSDLNLTLVLNRSNGNLESLSNAITRTGNNEIRVDLEPAYFSGILADSRSVQFRDNETGKILSELLVKP